jgi:hypothetical protein
MLMDRRCWIARFSSLTAGLAAALPLFFWSAAHAQTRSAPYDAPQPLTFAHPLDSSHGGWTSLDADSIGASLGDQQPAPDASRTPSTEPADASSPAAKKPFGGCKTCCRGLLIDWSKFPATIQPLPRPGIFPVPPTQGPAHYSFQDWFCGSCREAPPKSGYAPFALNAWPFFDADWRYVEGIEPGERTVVESLKRIHLNPCWTFSTGGEYWVRYTFEQNSRLTEAQNDYSLNHLRTYGDLWYGDGLRIYSEFIWADSFGEDLPPLTPDVDRGDLLDMFIDLKLFDGCGSPVFLRGGRQELVYGSQRLITALPWANKRHSFDGVKLFRHGEQWDFDAFWTQFVPANANEFDLPDDRQDFAGAWLTHKPQKGESIDLYYLFYDNDHTVVQQQIARAPLESHTLGSRWAGDHEGFLWDFEGAVQFGEQSGSELFAGMATAGLGRNLKEFAWSPTLWLYYDFASGDADPGTGNVSTFHPPFPFGHYYLGWADMIGRQNIHDVNAHLYLYPAPWITTWIQYHHFWLAHSRDALYNAGGVALRRDPTGLAGSDIGNEVDLVLNFHLTRYSDFLVSYAKLFGGDFLQKTAGPNQAFDAEALYLIYQHRW